MPSIQSRLLEKPRLSILVALVCGLLFYYCFVLIYVELLPLSLSVAKQLGPYFDYSWGSTAVLNILHAITAGAISSAIALLLLHCFLKPTTMFFFYIPMVEFLLIKNWWFLANLTVAVQTEQSEYLFLKLFGPVCVVLVFWLGALWLVRKNMANLSFNCDPLKRAR